MLLFVCPGYLSNQLFIIITLILSTHCNVQCPVQYYDYARIGVHGLSLAAFAFTRSPGRILKS